MFIKFSSNKLALSLVFITLFFINSVYAEDSAATVEKKIVHKDPVVFLSSVANNVLKNLRNKKEEIKDDQDKLYQVVYDTVVPHVDFVEIAKWVAGKKAWNVADESQKNEFLRQFKLIIVRTYATALNKYTDQEITFKPLSSNQKIRKRMQIASEVWDSRNNKNINVNFRIIESEDSWKVYDLVIEGVSLLKGFQAQFSNLIRTNGLGAAIAKMKEHNASILSDNIINALTKVEAS